MNKLFDDVLSLEETSVAGRGVTLVILMVLRRRLRSTLCLRGTITLITEIKLRFINRSLFKRIRSQKPCFSDC